MRAVNGFYGNYGGQFVPETLIPAMDQLEQAWNQLRYDTSFNRDLDDLLNRFAGRPTPVYEASRLSENLGLRLLFKREDLLHTGAHKINNTVGQALLTRHMGKKRVIAETGAGQHGVATAAACAMLGLDCTVYMGAVDAARQAPNVRRMKLMGAEVKLVETGSRTLKDAINVALQDFVASVETSHYIIGSVVGPHPYPEIVSGFQAVIGKEARDLFTDETLPDTVVACVGGGSNAIGIFQGFLDDKNVTLIGVEAGGRSDKAGDHARTIGVGAPGILHGCISMLLSNTDGQVLPVHSVSAGLDYPGIGPQHAHLNETGRVTFASVNDHEALRAVEALSRLEGIIPALESAHAVGYVMAHAGELRGQTVLVNLSGRGDKDMEALEELL